ncbi:MAG: extracellular solute-binding protein [Dehalococcoidia bacterium]|nr:extracellular solute-binding protein [Dehalococcoidia bacterium]
MGGAGSQGATKAAWEKDWDDLVAAAKKEGSLVLVTNLGPAFKNAAAASLKAGPGVTVELITQLASAFAPKAVQERQAGVYSYDVTTQPDGTVPLALILAGAMDPIRPLIMRPDILDDKSWQGGFEAGFPDKDKKWGYAGFQEVHRAVWINTDLIKEGEIKTFDDLLNPKWKGKIVGGDPPHFRRWLVAEHDHAAQTKRRQPHQTVVQGSGNRDLPRFPAADRIRDQRQLPHRYPCLHRQPAARVSGPGCGQEHQMDPHG